MLTRAGLELIPRGHAKPKARRPVDGLPAGISLGISPSKTRALRMGWVAFWSENKRQHKKTFSVFKYGFEEGLYLALKIRAEKTKLLATPSEVQAALTLRSLANQALQDHPSLGLPAFV